MMFRSNHCLIGESNQPHPDVPGQAPASASKGRLPVSTCRLPACRRRSTSLPPASTATLLIRTTRWTGCSRPKLLRRLSRHPVICTTSSALRSARWPWARPPTSGYSGTKSCWTSPGAGPTAGGAAGSSATASCPPCLVPTSARPRRRCGGVLLGHLDGGQPSRTLGWVSAVAPVVTQAAVGARHWAAQGQVLLEQVPPSGRRGPNLQ